MDIVDRLVSTLHRYRVWPWVFGLAYAATVALFVHRGPVLLVLPVAAVGAVALLYLDARLLWLLAYAALPVSVNLDKFVPGAAIALPSDPAAIVLLSLVVVKARQTFPVLRRAVSHPIVWVVCALNAWMLLTALTSQQPGVSLKFWANTTWFMGGFFVFGLVMFARPGRWQQWLVAGAVPTVAVVAVVLVRHAGDGFSFLGSYRAPAPFFHEKTSYAAYTAFLAAAYFLLALNAPRRTWIRLFWWGCFGLVFLGLVASYTRGAWLGFGIGLLTWFTLKYWRRFRWLFLLGYGTLAVLLAVGIQQLTEADSGRWKRRGLGDQLRSVFDTETNLSNRERLNRWVAALDMFAERPLLGFGPGTYAFQYAPFQHAKYRTWVSTNRGDIGTAHNEWLLAASEQGFLGAVWFTLLVGVSLRTGIRGYRRARAPDRRTAYAVALVGLITFYVHGLVNNFLDMDRLALLVYAALAVLVAQDRFHRPAA